MRFRHLFCAALYCGLLGGTGSFAEELLPVDIEFGAGKVYLSCSVPEDVRVYNGKGKELDRIALGAAAGDLVLSPDAARLIVCAGNGSGELLELDAESLGLLRRIPSGHSPVSPRFSPDGSLLAVAQRFYNEVWIYDAADLERIAVYPVGREPIALRWRSQEQLIIAHHLSSESAVADWTGCTIGLLGLANADFQEIPLEDGTSGIRDMALSTDGRYALCAGVIASHRVPATQIEQGWINKNGLCVVDLEARDLLGTLLLDELVRGAPNPWGIVLDDEAAWVSLAGSHELMRIDYPALIDELKGLNKKQREDFVYDLRRGRIWKQRIPLAGSGPRALAKDDQGRILIASYFSSGIERYDPKNNKREDVLPGTDIPAARRGEFLFHDATISFQHWMSCSSCHPDARTDSFNWDLENDGLGTPRQAKTMLFAHQTPPTTVTGIRPDAEYSVRAGIAFLRTVLPEEDAVAIDEYLQGLRPVPSPHLQNGKLSEKAIAGKELFQGKASCIDCHDGKYRTNMKLHWVGTGIGDEVEMKYDVPSLREIWRTAPYLHDGRAVSIREVLTTFNPDGYHGNISDLSEDELDQLIEYMKTL
jgi:hypothetical protein